MLLQSSCMKIMWISTGFTGTSFLFSLCFAVTYCSAKNSSLYLKVLALMVLHHAGPSLVQTLNIGEQMTFRCSLFVWKRAPPRIAFCQTSTQQWGLSTKGAPLCCWGYRWQVPLRCGCLKIKRSSVACQGPSVSVIASSRQLSGKLEGPN